MNDLGKILIGLGIGITVLGFILAWMPQVPGIGKMPGDILIKKENFSFYFPLTTCVLLSLVISLIIYLIGRQ